MMVDTCCGCKDINIYNIGCNTDTTGGGIRWASEKNHMTGCGISVYQREINKDTYKNSTKKRAQS